MGDYMNDDQLSELFETLSEKYSKPSHEYYRDARELLEDIQFIESFYHRTKKHQRMALELNIVGIGADHYWFVKRIFGHSSPSYWRQEDYMISKLRLIDICAGIAGKLLNDKNEINEDVLKDAISLTYAYGYYTSLDSYQEDLLGLIYYGCQTDTSNLKKRWNELDPELLTGDSNE